MSFIVEQIDQIPTSQYYNSLDLSSPWETTVDSTRSGTTNTSVNIFKIFDLGIKSHLLEWWNQNRVRNHEDTNHLEGLDDSSELLLTERQLEYVNDQEIPKIAGKLARLARTFHTIGDRTDAMEMVVKEWLVREMKKMSMRDNVIATVLPFALVYSFVPHRHELQARALQVQNEYVQRSRLVRPLFTRRRPWLFNWLGEKHTEPVARRA
jgi:hypothetical protein